MGDNKQAGDRKAPDGKVGHPHAEDAPDVKPLASSPCSLAEADALYSGHMTRGELTAFLNLLLEAQRAGVKVMAMMVSDPAAPPSHTESLREMSKEEARFCAMLTDQVERLGGAPSTATGPFEDKMRALPDFAARLALLETGIAWVIRKLREALPRVREDDIHRDLRTMLEVHEHSRATCRALLGGDPAARLSVS